MPDGAGSDRAHCSDPRGPRDVGGTLCCEWESGRSGQSRSSVGCVRPQQLCCPLGAAGRPHTLPAVLFPSGWHTKLSTSEKNYLEKHRVVGNAANTKGISSPSVRQSSAASRAQHHSKTKLLLELRWALNLQIHITILYIYIYIHIYFLRLSSCPAPSSGSADPEGPGAILTEGVSLPVPTPNAALCLLPQPHFFQGFSAQRIHPCMTTRGRISKLQHWELQLPGHYGASISYSIYLQHIWQGMDLPLRAAALS